MSTPETQAKRVQARGRWQKAFLRVFAEIGNVKLACQAVGVSRSTVYDHRREDPDFAKLWEDAEQQAADVLEAEAWRRANDGVDEPVFYKGQQCRAIRQYSDVLLMFLLKGIRPEKYRERFVLPPGELDRAIEAELAKARNEAAATDPTDLVN